MKKLSLETLQNKIITYQIIVMLSFVFGVVGFMYNNWRYEHNENNNAHSNHKCNSPLT